MGKHANTTQRDSNVKTYQSYGGVEWIKVFFSGEAMLWSWLLLAVIVDKPIFLSYEAYFSELLPKFLSCTNKFD